MTTAEVMTLATPSGLHNHWRCEGNCAVNGPFTLGDRELITGRSHRDRADDGTVFCTDCLDDLPAGLGQISHVCGPPAPREGDVVIYHGSLDDYHGTVWEVTHISRRGRLTLFDVDQAIRHVRPASVTVVGHRGR